MSKIVVLKGGPGSGNFEHAGIPGHQGGSAPSKDTNTWDEQTVHDIFMVKPMDMSDPRNDPKYQFGISSTVWEGDFLAWRDQEAVAEQLGVDYQTFKTAVGATWFGPFNDSYAGTGIVARAEVVLGLKRSDFDVSRDAWSKEHYAYATKKDIRNDLKANGFSPAARVLSDDKMDNIIKNTYVATQKLFKDKGITEITVYRGMTEKRSGTANLLESWTADKSIAERFSKSAGNSVGYVDEMTIPVERIFAVPAIGWGVNTQLEVIVLNGVPTK